MNFISFALVFICGNLVSQNTFFNNCQNDAYIIKVKQTKHFDYSDLPYITSIGKKLKISGKATNKDFIPDLNHVILGFFNEYLKNDLKDWIEKFEKKYDSSIKFK